MTMRTSSVASLALCVALGFGLFRVKYAVQNLEEDLVKIERQTALDREQIHVLNAEWSFLTTPNRLEKLAARHLTLQPLTPAQVGFFDTLRLKGDDPLTAQAAGAVAIADVLKAMQVAATSPVPAASPSARSRAME